MSTIVENIAAFSTWKMFNDTVPMLIKDDCSETSIKRLANIIQKKEFSHIFIFCKEPGMEFEQYQAIEARYKAVTTWLLGHFFYLLGHERFSKVHDIVVDTQLCILDRFSKTQLYIYRQLANEYLKAFELLIEYRKKPPCRLILKVFVPENFEDLNAKLDLSQAYIEISSKEKCVLVIENFDDNTYKTLDNLLYLLAEEDVQLKLDVIEIFLDIFNKSRHNFNDYNLEITRNWTIFLSLFEQFFYNVYNSQIHIGDKIHRFETLLTSYLDLHCDLKSDNRVNTYIFKKSLNKCDTDLMPSETVILAALRDVRKTPHCDDSTLIEATVNGFGVSFYYFQHNILKEIRESKVEPRDMLNVKAYNSNTSRTWHIMYRRIIENLKEFFNHITNMLLQIKWDHIGIPSKLTFFEEKELIVCFVSKFQSHVSNCGSTITPEKYLKFFLNLMITSNSRNIDIIFHIIAYPLLIPWCYKSDNQFPDGFIAEGALSEVKMATRSFYSFLATQDVDKRTSFQLVDEFFTVISSGLLNLNGSQKEQIETLYLKICGNILSSKDQDLLPWVIGTLPHVLTLFEGAEDIITGLLKSIFTIQNTLVQEKLTSILPDTICCLSSDFVKVLDWDDARNKLNVDILCEKCCSHEKKAKTAEILDSRYGEGAVGINFGKLRVDLSAIMFVLKHVLVFIANGTADLKISSLKVLPVFSSHVSQFHSTAAAKIWIELAGDHNKNVRKEFSKVIGLTIKYGQNDWNGLKSKEKDVSSDTKSEILNLVFTTLLTLTKKSLQFTDVELQDTLLSTIEDVSRIKNEQITLELLKLLIYFVMVPTSRQSLIAVNACFEMAKRNDTTTTQIYSQNKKELCEVLAHLCYINQALINHTLCKSLEKTSLMLGFYSPKEFLVQESNYLLPFLVAKTVKAPAVTALIQEMANLMDFEVSEMLACKYGYIFIYIFLDVSNDDLKKCMLFLEKNTGMTGPSLRKRNFRIILNELLLNFHEKRDRVELALKLLANEDIENKSTSIPDYLQSHFLGVLLYFDVRLISKNSKKDKILLSLADLFKFMGPKHIMPLRFKIIAMLQTVSYESFPHLHCKVWKAFIHSCEIESLGPQLATIFVSVLPLLEHCPRQINDILKYLVVENEVYTRDHIPDLFFVDNSKVDYTILNVIKSSLKSLEQCTLKEKIKKFLKYLNHETMEVRVQGLKQLKTYLEQSREELDQMILDYNGIDPVIVELIDILTLGCREKDETLKLLCGGSFWGTGYTQDNESFSFFINQDTFITSALNELIKALQTEKNTQNMDRYALAIQEILKDHEISPEQSSSKNYLWQRFQQSQREVMMPLLSWTCSLISSLPDQRRQLLEVCLPSMKQNNRILMHFLPHILLHALLEDCNDIHEKSFQECETITNSFTKKTELDQKVLNLRPIKIPGVTAELQVVTPEEEKQMQCTRVVFVLLDFLDRWIREWRWQKGLEGLTDENFLKVKKFQSRFCKLGLARSNYHCGEYPRALMYLEDYITENSGEIYNHLFFLAEIYAQLEESDGVAGVTALQVNEPSVEQRVLALEVCGKLADATTCYERIGALLLGSGQCEYSAKFARGAMNNQPEFGNMLLEMQAEPLWRLGQYDEARRSLAEPGHGRQHELGRTSERNEFKSTLNGLLKQNVESFGAASLEEGAYQHGYNCVSKLHALTELQQVEKTLHELLLKPNDQIYCENLLKKLTEEWMLRIKVVQESVRVIEPLLCLRRVSLSLTKKIAEGKNPTSRTPVKFPIRRMHQQAYTYTIKAEEFAPNMLFLEKAKLHWLREEHEQALTTLRRGLEIIIPEGDRQQLASMSVEQKHYKDAVEIYREWEKSFVCLGQYYDKIFQNYSDADRDSKGSDMQLYMINYFGKSLLYGTNYVYQSMPRLLSIWFDYGTRLLDVTQSSVREERKSVLLKMTKLIDSFLERLPAYVFLTAFSQLVSRICHPQRVTPCGQRGALKSCAIPRLKTNMMTKLVRDFTSLAEKLIELCNKEIAPDVQTTTVNSLLRTLPRMLSKDDFSEIMMPTYNFRKLILPNPDFQSSQHNPFPNHYVHIVGIEDEVVVLQSLQRPRKITLKGSDGKGYIYMLKPKDDLRKDFRFMEFNDIVNHLLAREPEARQRRLNIRLYSVAPLNEECGLIEWIPKLVGLRPVIMKLYKQRGLVLTMREIKERSCNIRDSLDRKREIFTKKLLPLHPPVLSEWFRKTFPDAQSWLTARTAYIRTTAVMSMVGYILGLGDRHGENILLDSTCGDVVHVDFNCLFNKGESLDWPERVPFRLTHNMVSAMGPLKVEGIFRKSCACTLRVLRTNANTLMSIVTPFVYDPLVSWPRNISALPSTHNAERTNEQAVDHVKNIELRLQGKVKTRNRTLIIPLSVDGQVNYLINEAISLDNLCQMYIGWGPYL
ncbi:hypothetical protein NQ318_016037 [Aromia moschata]|uniref:Serine/threonine-protein kinase ATR n=1 Tax=Aromia moschata TaxID=1265417 RepID=A0AAV8XIT4_9CUCU|nr:hypothetical protein NQ318_016037 [Aromia moschata]